jgi:dolichyl-phosphate-mannose-protein mannosyltransferase
MVKTKFKEIWKKNKTKIILVLILVFSFITKAYRLAHPDTHIFDEIYAGYTAEQYAKGNINAFIWDYPADEGFAYNWDHPPLGREIMSVPIKILGVSSLSRRIVPLISGVLLSLVVFKIAQLLFPKKDNIALIAAFLIACDGLVFTLSRIALVDSTLTLFITTSIYFLFKKDYLTSAIFWGAASSCKWTGVFLAPYIAFVVITQQVWQLKGKNKKKVNLKNILTIIKTGLVYILVGAMVYLAAYIPVFINFGFEKFIHVQQQAYWYHSRLEADHPATSPAYTWPLNLKPVWFWVEYKDGNIANIYALGHPLIFWCGFISIPFIFALFIQNKDKRLLYIFLAYFTCWIQWLFSPRIMFLYHYLPAVPFLCISLAYTFGFITKLDKKLKYFIYLYLLFILITFFYFYPFWSGMPIPEAKVDNYRWLPTWK